MKTANSKKRPAVARAAGERSSFDRALEALTRYLSVRDHSRFELQTKLERRFEASTVAEVLTYAARKRWLLKEQTVAENLVEQLVRKHKSQRFIENELEKRHLPVPVLPAAEQDLLNARLLLQRKFGVQPLSLEDQAKAYRFLKYRGFDERAIQQVLNEKR
jgi:regulatory protein